MAALLNVFRHLYTIAVSFFNLLLLKALFLIRSFVPGTGRNQESVQYAYRNLRKAKGTTVLPDEIVVNYHQLRDNILNGGSYDDIIFLLSALYGRGKTSFSVLWKWEIEEGGY
ncbi:hypothetical protein POTOM_027312 [Populus tomentosa]|uniref:Uncharacterized protein n=1 Tax=Populus tomentosa TaxID=118781 RepID=A0A8X7ZBD2_POPTO|nr:hypothetical protein POTOM_027312 [Populus tomentosa]